MRNKFKSPKSYDNESLFESELRAVVSELFPLHPIITWQQATVEEEIAPFTLEEVKRGSSQLRPKKAPGPDRIPPEIIESFLTVTSPLALTCLIIYLLSGTFPIEWRRPILFLLPKSKKAGIKKYRLICLLNGLWKVFDLPLSSLDFLYRLIPFHKDNLD